MDPVEHQLEYIDRHFCRAKDAHIKAVVAADQAARLAREYADLIKKVRKAKKVPWAWVAQRLGVTRSTIHNYMYYGSVYKVYLIYEAICQYEQR